MDKSPTGKPLPRAASGTPRRRRKAARPGEIIAAGLACFAEHGYERTRLEDVATRAGIGKSTLYLYFESKEALFRATVAAHVDSTFTEMRHLVDRHEGSAAALLQLVLTKAYERFVRSEALTLLRIIIAEGDRFPELRRFFYEAEICHGRELLERLLAHGIASGEFRAGPVSAHPRLLVAPVITAAVWRMTFDEYEPIDLDAWLLAHVDLILDGLRVR